MKNTCSLLHVGVCTNTCSVANHIFCTHHSEVFLFCLIFMSKKFQGDAILSAPVANALTLLTN